MLKFTTITRNVLNLSPTLETLNTKHYKQFEWYRPRMPSFCAHFDCKDPKCPQKLDNAGFVTLTKNLSGEDASTVFALLRHAVSIICCIGLISANMQKEMFVILT